MPYSNTQPALPWQGRSSQAKHCSERAAVSASATRVYKSREYLAWLKKIGQATDWGAVDHFVWPMSTVCSVRNGLVERGLVEAFGTCLGRYGKAVTIWKAK